MNKAMYCQTRIGQFAAHVIPRGQCGFASGQQTFGYSVEVCTRQLDPHGFIMDNRDLDRLFDKWTSGRWQASCEDLAAGGVCQVLDALGDRVESVKCTVSPNVNASLCCQWVRGDERPDHCPVRVTGDRHHERATSVTKYATTVTK